MITPKLICFDYGETLISEKKFDGVKGYELLLDYAERNPYHRSATDLAEIAKEMNEALGRFDPARKHLIPAEVSDSAFQAYLLESQGIQLKVPYSQLATAFWDAAASGEATDGIEDFLAVVRGKKIKTCVISNISFSGDIVDNRIRSLIPSHSFDFVISSCDYVFRKPNPKIFELALEKAGTTAAQTWHCGDQYLCDIEGAMQAGIQPIWYTKGEKQFERCENGVIIISEWKDLIGKLG